MSYLAALKNILVAERAPSEPLSRLELVVDNSEVKAVRSAWQPVQNSEESLIDVIQWRVRALGHIKNRLAGYVRGMPLSLRDAEVYRRMIDERCKRLGLNLENEPHGDLSVLSVPWVRVNSELGTQIHSSSSHSTISTPTNSELHMEGTPTEPTKGGR